MAERKKKPGLYFTGKAQPGAPDWSKMTPEQARQAYAAEVAREQARKNSQALPGAGPQLGREYFAQHPLQAQYMDQMLGYLGTDLNTLRGFGDDVVSRFSRTELPGTPRMYGTPETVVPKNVRPQGQPSKRSELRQRMMGALGPMTAEINKQYAIGDDEAESVLHGFMDSDHGLDAVADENEFLDKTRTGYSRFVQQWAGVKDGERRLKVNDPVVVDAEGDRAEVAKAFADNKPVVIKNASKYGFMGPDGTDEVVVYGDGRTGKDPQKILDARRPVITKPDFIDVLKYIRGR